jgi:hypothetical protein
MGRLAGPPAHPLSGGVLTWASAPRRPLDGPWPAGLHQLSRWRPAAWAARARPRRSLLQSRSINSLDRLEAPALAVARDRISIDPEPEGQRTRTIDTRIWRAPYVTCLGLQVLKGTTPIKGKEAGARKGLDLILDFDQPPASPVGLRRRRRHCAVHVQRSEAPPIMALGSDREEEMLVRLQGYVDLISPARCFASRRSDFGLFLFVFVGFFSMLRNPFRHYISTYFFQYKFSHSIKEVIQLAFNLYPRRSVAIFLVIGYMKLMKSQNYYYLWTTFCNMIVGYVRMTMF